MRRYGFGIVCLILALSAPGSAQDLQEGLSVDTPFPSCIVRFMNAVPRAFAAVTAKVHLTLSSSAPSSTTVWLEAANGAEASATERERCCVESTLAVWVNDVLLTPEPLTHSAGGTADPPEQCFIEAGWTLRLKAVRSADPHPQSILDLLEVVRDPRAPGR